MINDRDTVPLIRASEIGQYIFCARGWWLERVKGYPSAHTREMAAGQVAHLEHGRVVLRYHRLQRWAYMLLALATLLGAAWLYSLARGL